MADTVTISATLYNSIQEATEDHSHTMNRAVWDSSVASRGERRSVWYLFIADDGADYLTIESYSVRINDGRA